MVFLGRKIIPGMLREEDIMLRDGLVMEDGKEMLRMGQRSMGAGINDR